MEDGSALLFLSTTVISILLVAAASAARGSLSVVSRAKYVEIFKSSNRRRIGRHFSHLGTYAHVAVFARITFIFMSLGFAYAAIVATDIENPYLYAAWAIVLTIVIYLAQAFPYHLGLTKPEKTLRYIFPGLYLLSFVFYPIVKPVRAAVGRMEKKADSGISSEEKLADSLQTLVEKEERSGQLDDEHTEIIKGLIDYLDAEASEVMTPRTDVFQLDVNTPLDDVVRHACDKGFSRYPVFEETRDNIIGVLHIKDILRHWDTPEKVTLRGLMRKPFFVPETVPIRQLLAEFKKRQLHVAIVLDEYGGTAGLVSVEDLLEEIVGDIEDEYDTGAESFISFISPRVAIADGRLDIDDLNDMMPTTIPDDEDYETLSGFMLSRLGRIPTTGETTEFASTLYTVLDADDRRIKRIKIEIKDTLSG